MTKKIYVLTSKWNDEDNNIHIEGSFTTLKGAQKRMMHLLNQEVSDICDSEDIESVDSLELNETDNMVFGEFGDYRYSYDCLHACIDYDVYFEIVSSDLMSDEDEFVYIATTTEKREGDDAEFFVLGQYDNLEDARMALTIQFVNDTDCLDSDEDNDEWERTDLDDLGSFRYEYDQYTYFEYNIEKRRI